MPNMYTDQGIFIMIHTQVPTIQIKYKTFPVPQEAPLFLFPINSTFPPPNPETTTITICYHDAWFHLLHLHALI